MKLSDVLKLFTLACYVFRLFNRKKPHKGTFLIVEDNEDDAYNLQRIIQKRGWTCEVAASAEVAQGLIKHRFYPAVFIDLQLPGMSGAAFMRLLSKDYPDSHCIIVCGDTSRLNDIPDGVLVHVVRKPARLETLETILEKLKL